MKENEKIICFKNVSKKLGNATRINNLTVQFEKGKVYGLIGPNGAGKTTFFNLLTGIYRRDTGEITVSGLDPIDDCKKVRRLIGFVPQYTSLYPELSGKDNLMYHGSLYLKNMKNIKTKIEKILELVELSSRSNEPIKNYSGGMKRRLSIGRALLCEPKILLLDEPTLGVDVQSTHRIWAYIKEIKKRDTVIIVATNIMAEADFLSDEIILLDKGKKIAFGPLNKLKQSLEGRTISIEIKENIEKNLLISKFKNLTKIENRQLIFSTDNVEEDLVQIVNTLKPITKIENINFAKPSLDDVFLSKTGRNLRD